MKLKIATAGGRERADPGRRLAGRPAVARVQRVVAPDAPEVEGERHHDHGDGDEVELGGEELRALPGEGVRRRRAQRSPRDGTARLSRVAKCAGRSPACRRATAASRRATSSSLICHPSAPAFCSAWERFLAPGIGDRALGDEPGQRDLARAYGRRGPHRCGAGRPRCASTCSIGWAEKVRLPGGGLAAEYLPVRRPCPIGE